MTTTEHIADDLVRKYMTTGPGGVINNARKALVEMASLQRRICADAVYSTRGYATKQEIYNAVLEAGTADLSNPIM